MTPARTPLNLDLDDLEDFKPRGDDSPPVATVKRQVDRAASFPSRDPEQWVQVNIRAAPQVAERFRAMAKAERYRLDQMLEVLMDAYEPK